MRDLTDEEAKIINGRLESEAVDTTISILDNLRSSCETQLTFTEEEVHTALSMSISAIKELEKAKELLKAAIEDMATNDAWDCETCEYYGVLNCDRCVEVDDCYKWRHIDEVLALIGEEDKNNGV